MALMQMVTRSFAFQRMLAEQQAYNDQKFKKLAQKKVQLSVALSASMLKSATSSMSNPDAGMPETAKCNKSPPCQVI